MGGLAHQFDFGNAETLSELIEANNFRLTKSRDTVGAITIHPGNVVVFLAGEFYEVAQKGQVVGWKFHVG
jgi:hypothetical protein